MSKKHINIITLIFILCFSLTGCSKSGTLKKTGLKHQTESGINKLAPEAGKQVKDINAVAKRIAMTRIYQQNTWTIEDKTAKEVGEELARLQPTWTSGLIKLSSDEALTTEKITAYNTIRDIVLTLSPTCKFDFTLDAKEYSTSEQIVAKMQEINSKLKVDIWFFDFYSASYKDHPEIIKGAVDYAHSQNQLIGGNVSVKEFPEGSDFLAVNDGYGLDKMHNEITTLKKIFNGPIVMHLNSDEEISDRNIAEQFVAQWNEAERIEYVSKLAENQGTYNFRLMYPVFFPEFPAKHSYDSSKDGKMPNALFELTSKYN